MPYFFEMMMTCILGMLLCGIVTPKIFQVAFRRRLFDAVDSRKVHGKRIPRLGGIAFFPSIFIAVALVAIAHRLITGEELFGYGFTPMRMLSFFSSLFMIYLMGIADDLIGMKYRSKLTIQLLCSLLIVGSGCYLDHLYGLFGIAEIPCWIGAPLTVFVCVYIMNAFNFIDGIDGLAAAMAIIAFVAFGVMFAVLQWWIYALIAFAAVGVLLAFFYYNVIGRARHRKIFMGDTGSLTLGFMLGVLAVRLSMYDPAKATAVRHAFVLTFSFLMVPLFDVARVVLHRLRRGKSPFLPDRNHIHHKFMALGLTPLQTLGCIVTLSLGFAALNLLLCSVLSITVLLLVDIFVWTLIHVLLSKMPLCMAGRLSASKHDTPA